MGGYHRCCYCNGRWDRPGLYGCEYRSHPIPTPAQQIVADIETALNRRKGLGWGDLDADIADEIRDRLAEIVQSHLSQSKGEQ